MSWYNYPDIDVSLSMLNQVVSITEKVIVLDLEYINRNSAFLGDSNNSDSIEITKSTECTNNLDPFNAIDYLKAFREISGIDSLNSNLLHSTLAPRALQIINTREFGNFKKFLSQIQSREYHPLLLSGYFTWFLIHNQFFKDKEINDNLAIYWQKIILRCWKPVFDVIITSEYIEDYQSSIQQLFGYKRHHTLSNPTKFLDFHSNMIMKHIEQVNVQDKPFDNYDCVQDQKEGVQVTIDANDSKQNLEVKTAYETKILQNDLKLSAECQNLLDMLDANREYSKKELMALTAIDRLPTFSEKMIKPLLDLELIKMTHPEKPTSKNQKYFLVVADNEKQKIP